MNFYIHEKTIPKLHDYIFFNVKLIMNTSQTNILRIQIKIR